MWPPSSAVGKRSREIDGAVEVERAVGLQIDVQRFEVCGRVDEPDVFGLQEVVGHDEVLLVGSDFDVMWAYGRLDLVGIVEAFDILEVGDVKGGDVVGCRQGDCCRVSGVTGTEKSWAFQWGHEHLQ